MKRHFKHSHCKIAALISSALLLLASCSGLFNQSSENFDDGKAYISIGVSRVKRYSDSKTYYPTSISPDELINFRLTGLLEGEDSEKLLATAESITKFEKLEITPGAWTFTLSATYNGITYADTVRYNINYGNNRVSFELKSTAASGNGGFNITVDLSSDTNADLVKATLSTLDGSVKETKTFDFSELPSREIIYSKKNLDNDEESLTPGTYHILFEFFAKNGSDENIVLTELNQWESYICILSQVVTEARISLNLNEVYTIEYYDQDQEPINFVNYGFAGTAIEKYSVRSHFTLPVLVKEGFIFEGWYESSDFSGTPVTRIEKGSSGKKTLYARFVSPTLLYVSQSGNDEYDGMSSSTALASVNKAVERIISYGNIAAAYTIKISGTITGGVNITSTLTTEMASSLTLEGVTGKTGDTWVDVLDGGFTDSSRGTTLAINSAVPVTLKNLKITGGYQGQGNGGGVRLGGDSSLVMESGEISGNTANDGGQASAGGVYISHGGTSNFGATQIAGAKFTMKGGSICNNTGTGVTLYDGSNPGEFNMYGGTITDNSGYGVNLVYSTDPFGKFTMKGDAVVAANNKVFIGFPNGTKIYIAGELTGSAPVATVSLNGYNENTEIVALAEGVTDTSLLSAACTKIEVAPNNSTPWYLTSDGKLTATNPNSSNGSSDTHEYVDLGLPSGTLWATMNVGATSVTDSGTDFYWNVDPSDESISTNYHESGDTLLPTDDHATVAWGSDWVTPTSEQLQELYDNCYFEPVTSYNGVTINGYIVYFAKDESHVHLVEQANAFLATDMSEYIKSGYSETDPHIFLPAVNGGNDVWMWSSTYRGKPATDYVADLFGLVSSKI